MGRCIAKDCVFRQVLKLLRAAVCMYHYPSGLIRSLSGLILPQALSLSFHHQKLTESAAPTVAVFLSVFQFPCQLYLYFQPIFLQAFLDYLRLLSALYYPHLPSAVPVRLYGRTFSGHQKRFFAGRRCLDLPDTAQ